VSDSDLLIDAWLMSCRVLGRGVERLLLNDLLVAACTAGMNALVGFYKPTDRNGLVKNHFSQLGFSPDGGGEGVERWRLTLDGAKPLETFITANTPLVSA
jgi:predicted enzyme involved in methoxymalonyl-ACP biosynthesis